MYLKIGNRTDSFHKTMIPLFLEFDEESNIDNVLDNEAKRREIIDKMIDSIYCPKRNKYKDEEIQKKYDELVEQQILNDKQNLYIFASLHTNDIKYMEEQIEKVKENTKTRKFVNCELITTGDDLIRAEDNKNLYTYHIDNIKYDISKMYSFGEGELSHVNYEFGAEAHFNTNHSITIGLIKKIDINDKTIKESLDKQILLLKDKFIKLDEYSKVVENNDKDLNVDYYIGNIDLITNGNNEEEYFLEIPVQICMRD